MATSVIEHIPHNMAIIHYSDMSLTTGALSIPYPTGYTSADNVIIQPIYGTTYLLGWTATVQKTSSLVYLYVRQGTTLPADGSKIAFTAFFIKA